MAVLQRCPICEGHGRVAGGFYLRTPGLETWVAGSTSETCRTCRGSGTVLVQEKERASAFGIDFGVFFQELNKIRKFGQY